MQGVVFASRVRKQKITSNPEINQTITIRLFGKTYLNDHSSFLLLLLVVSFRVYVCNGGVGLTNDSAIGDSIYILMKNSAQVVRKHTNNDMLY